MWPVSGSNKQNNSTDNKQVKRPQPRQRAIVGPIMTINCEKVHHNAAKQRQGRKDKKETKKTLEVSQGEKGQELWGCVSPLARVGAMKSSWVVCWCETGLVGAKEIQMVVLVTVCESRHQFKASKGSGHGQKYLLGLQEATGGAERCIFCTQKLVWG